jgi:hypothetical protein
MTTVGSGGMLITSSRLLKKAFVHGTSPNPRVNTPESERERCSLFQQPARAWGFIKSIEDSDDEVSVRDLLLEQAARSEFA